QDFRPDGEDTTHLVLGLQGLAPHWWEIDAAAFLSTEGDLTARVEAEAQSAGKTRFLANMSHEIRTPLNGVIGLSQALAKTDLTAEQREMLDLMQASGKTLQTLLSDILDLARVESGKLELTED
ncbi:copper resistance protein B, partial [Lactiplantibacillus plantarum]|nr:copper resistance protein B [Lactiplantibacillus plantarum]